MLLFELFYEKKKVMSSPLLKTAENEKEHAKMWFKELKGIGTKTWPT